MSSSFQVVVPFQGVVESPNTETFFKNRCNFWIGELTSKEHSDPHIWTHQLDTHHVLIREMVHFDLEWT